MASIENSCEALEVLLLGAQMALAGVQIVRQDEDSEGDKDRIVVSAARREAELRGKSEADVKFWRVPVTIELKLTTKSAANYDAYIVAIEAAQKGNPPANAITFANDNLNGATNPGYPRIELTDEGDKTSEGKTRERSRVVNIIVPAA